MTGKFKNNNRRKSKKVKKKDTNLKITEDFF